MNADLEVEPAIALEALGWTPDKAHYAELFTLGMMRGAEVLVGILVAMIVDGRPTIIGEEQARTDAHDITMTALKRFSSVLPEDVGIMSEKLRQTLLFIEVMQRGTGDDGATDNAASTASSAN